MKSLRQMFDAFRGAGEAAVTIPSMDGALRPNSLLDGASVVFDGKNEQVSCVVSDGERCLFASGRILYALNDSSGVEPVKLATCDGWICALAVHRSGRVAIGVSGSGLFLRDASSALRPIQVRDQVFNCLTGLAFEDSETLIVTNGSVTNGPELWCRDLMEKNRSGSVWRVNLGDGAATQLVKGLAYPCGVVVGSPGAVVSEGWRHRLLFLKDGQPTVVLDDLPGYPGSIAASGDGGYWLAVFAPRRQLVEFVLREDRYRRVMMATLDERHWVAPALKTGLDYFEPVQSGGVRHLGMVKPWGPTRSYGLVIGLDSEFNPRSSYHSRAGASRHGITAVAEWRGRVIAACAATNQLLALDPTVRED